METILSSGFRATHTPGLYFDGELQDMIEYDLVHLESGELQLGMSMVTVKCADGTTVEAVAYLYHGINVPESLRGYISLTTDGESNIRARNHMLEKSKFI